MSDAAKRLGVAGAGTMGAGIAQLACLAGFDTYLHDPFPEALERGGEEVRRRLKGRAAEPVLAESLEELGACGLIVEAIPAPIVPAPTTPTALGSSVNAP